MELLNLLILDPAFALAATNSNSDSISALLLAVSTLASSSGRDPIGMLAVHLHNAIIDHLATTAPSQSPALAEVGDVM